MPRTLALSSETIMALSRADDALGRLASAGKYLRDPAMFVRPYVTREAVASSRIEGTEASLEDVFQAAAAKDRPINDDVREVQNYIAALDRGIELLPSLPISQRMICELHEVLMTGVRGREKRPGQLRDHPVYIGSPDDSPETAVFVPPVHRDLPRLLGDWEEFANDPQPQLPDLVRCAMLHYQFETIHPFMDGNGRLGRLLIVFFLVKAGRLPAPLLYISAFLEEYRRDYYDRLQSVRERGELEEWIRFFLGAVIVQAEDAGTRSLDLFDLREKYRSELAGNRSRASEVVDLLFENPYVTARAISARLKMTDQGALKLIHKLESLGWLAPIGTFGRGGRAYWAALEVYRIINREPAREMPSDRGETAMTQAG